jgi:hypothetical protein
VVAVAVILHVALTNQAPILVMMHGTPTLSSATVVQTTYEASRRSVQERPMAIDRELPLAFAANQGQTDRQVNFLAHGSGYSVFFTPTEVVFLWRTPAEQPAAARHRSGTPREETLDKETTAVLRMQFVGANPAPCIRGIEELPAKVHYLRGRDPAQWQTNVATYAKLRYAEVYPGVDVIFYGRQGQLAYDLVLAPGADPNAIVLVFHGAIDRAVDAAGDLVLSTAGGEMRQRRPFIYQAGERGRQAIPSRYVLRGAELVGFQVAAYDVAKPLVIDPVLTYSTYLGGRNFDVGRGLAVDDAGQIYVTGFTASSDFPTVDATQPVNQGLEDIFVAKIQAGALMYSTYIGGSGLDQGAGLAVDAEGHIYVTGRTTSSDFPIVQPFQAALGGGNDAFVLKLKADGSALVYSTYLGGSGNDRARGIAVDASGQAYVAGLTASSDFPTVNPFQASFAGGLEDAFVAKVDVAGSALVYCTFLGGSDNDRGNGIAVGAAGDAYVTGRTASSDFPTARPLQAMKHRRNDAFVTKLDAVGATLVYSTFLGGSGDDEGKDIALDPLGHAYITGGTGSRDFPMMHPLQAAFGGGADDAFVARLDAVGSALIYSTYVGGRGTDFGNGIAVDAAGQAYVTGFTSSDDFPTVHAAQAARGGGNDAFIALVSVNGSRLFYATYLGGDRDDFGRGIAIDAADHMYIVGYTSSTNFPTVRGALQRVYGGFVDAFVAKFASFPHPAP